MADDQRIRPTVQGRARLLQAVAAVPPAHVIDPGALGEYAQLVAEFGGTYAEGQAPDVAAHLATGCPACTDDLLELLELARDENHVGFESPPARTGDDSGIHLRDLPDPRHDEAHAEARSAEARAEAAAHAAEVEAARRQQARKWRERLLIAAAVAVLLMGLSLIGLAYLASGSRETPRLELAPQPPATTGPAAPATQPAPSGPPAAPGTSGFAPPDGMNCPATHPIKGNRNSGIYHLPGGGLYEATRPEQCFAQPSDAEAAGYRRSQR